MATYLELCQAVAKESGTVPGEGQPTSVSSQVGRLNKIVRWTNRAWETIQNERDGWRWMQGEFEGDTVAAQQRYSASDLGIARFGEWKYTGLRQEPRFSLFDPAIGRNSEGPLNFLSWDDFYATQLRGSEQEGKPVWFSISPQEEIVLSPTPDKTYTVRGLYRKGVQTLTENTDVPEMPARFHDAIMWRALLFLATDDESVVQLPLWRLEYQRLMSDLQRDQLPRMTFTQEPLA